MLDFGIAKALSLSRRLTRNEFGSVPYCVARAPRFGRRERAIGPLVAGRDALRNGHRACSRITQPNRATGAHDPLAHPAAARARSLSRTAAAHPAKAWRRTRNCATHPRTSSPKTWAPSAAASRFAPPSEDLDATRRTVRRAEAGGTMPRRRTAPSRAMRPATRRARPRGRRMKRADRVAAANPRPRRRLAGKAMRGVALLAIVLAGLSGSVWDVFSS